MSGILSFVTGLLGGIGSLFSGGLAQVLSTLVENLVTVGLLAFAIALGAFAIVYLNRRRRTLDQQRMAALIKGLHYAGVAHDVLARPKADARDHLLSGLRWLFGAAGLSSAMYGYESMQPAATPDAGLCAALIGLIPGALGLAHLLFSWLSRKPASGPVARPGNTYRVAYRPAVYRAAGRRF